jgi:hypothetical protein
MKLKIPGQLKGRDCTPVMHALIALRKRHEKVFTSMTSPSFDEICVIFRVGGSGGSFGNDAIERVYVERPALCCEVILAPRDWPTIGGDFIDALVRSRFEEAMLKIRGSEYGGELS